jgi:alpha/beta superfamily hydrolase
VSAALTWMRHRWPTASIWLSGFSFGAAMALRASSGAAPPAALITVAPALRWLNQAEKAPSCPWLIVQGDQDELVDAQAVQSWVNALHNPPRLALLPGAEHFFHGRLNDLRDIVKQWLTAHAS